MQRGSRSFARLAANSATIPNFIKYLLSPQLLAINGFITINHGSIEDKLMDIADLNHDGKIDKEDLKIAQERGMELLQYGIPSVGGFASGVAMGLRQG